MVNGKSRVVDMRMAALLLPLLMTACGSPDDKTPNPNANPEDFAAFFDRFHTDSTFQTSRIHDPLIYQYFESAVDDGGQRVEQLPASTWRYRNFDAWIDSIRNPVRVTFNGHRRTAAVSQAADSVVFQLAQPESDALNMRFLFERKNAKWYLTQVDDESL